MLTLDVSPALQRARRTLRTVFPVDRFWLVDFEARPWVSATFDGMRYHLVIGMAPQAEPALIEALRATFADGAWLPDDQVLVDICMRAGEGSGGQGRQLIVEVLALIDAR